MRDELHPRVVERRPAVALNLPSPCRLLCVDPVRKSSRSENCKLLTGIREASAFFVELNILEMIMPYL